MTVVDDQDWEWRLVVALQRLVPDEQHGRKGNRAALARLRRGLAEERPSWGVVTPVLRVLPDDLRPDRVRDALLVAGLFATHQQQARSGLSFGGSMGLLRKARHGLEEQTTPTDRRFEVLIASDRRALDHHLRQAVALMRQPGAGGPVAVDFAALLRDLSRWDSRYVPEGGATTAGDWVRFRWLRDYHRYSRASSSEKE